MLVTKELRAEIRGRREIAALEGGREVPGSVPFLRAMLATLGDPMQRDELLGELSGEYLRADLEDDHLLVQRERVSNSPDAAIPLLGLAHSLSMRADGAAEAKVVAAKAVAISRKTGALIRYSLISQALVAKRILDAGLFENTLIELIEDAANHRQEDSGFMGELLTDLPVGFCSSEVARRYAAVSGSNET